jgi:hypothetical protein
MAKDQPSKTTTLEMNPSEATQLGLNTDEGKTLMGIGSDDFVVITNLFDGKGGRPSHELIMKWGNVKHRWAPGQTVNLPGYKGRHFLLHLVKMLYLRVDDKPEMDKRDYPLTDKWVKQALVRIQPMMSPDEDESQDTVQELPDYVANDENLSSIAGTGEHVLPTVKDIDADATDESEQRLENDPKLNITPSTIDKDKTAAKNKAKEAGRLE